MAKTKRRKTASKKQSKSVYIFIILVCIVCFAYEPISKALAKYGIELPAVGGTDAPASDKNKEDSAGTLQLPGTAKLELPAPLTDRKEQILYRYGFTISFNSELNLPNWVAWELNPEKLVERESRYDKFLPDPDLPEDLAVTTQDYTGSGWDRGHMCPAGDNRWHWRAMRESFYMTNICPQNHNLNRGDWKELEEDCRRWAEEEGRIHIVCGPILYRGKHKTIGKEHRVTVPEAFFKVVLCTESNPPKAIGFIFKNTSGNHALDSYVNTVDQVERITGIDFFPALPDEVEQEVESKADIRLWNR